MAEYLIQDTTLTAIADAIREKTGDEVEIAVSAMADTIQAIEIPKAVETTVDLDFSGGAMEVNPEAEELFSKVNIPIPANLTPENIAEGVDIAGIVGALATGGVGALKFAYAVVGKKSITYSSAVSETLTPSVSIPIDAEILAVLSGISCWYGTSSYYNSAPVSGYVKTLAETSGYTTTENASSGTRTVSHSLSYYKPIRNYGNATAHLLVIYKV